MQNIRQLHYQVINMKASLINKLNKITFMANIFVHQLHLIIFFILYKCGLAQYVILRTRSTYVKLNQAYKHVLYLHSRIDMWLCYEIKVYVKKTSSITYACRAPVEIPLSFMYAKYFNTLLNFIPYRSNHFIHLAKCITFPNFFKICKFVKEILSEVNTYSGLANCSRVTTI
jgi:hypothetical protein